MKKFILVSALFTLSLSSWGGISIVSDLDDTIKITNSGDEIDGALNAAFSSKVFVGINELWMGMKMYTNEQHILSASPGVLRPKIVSTLKKHQIAYSSIILKNPLKKEDKFTYKVKMIEEIMKTNSDDFIFLGDDVGQDPEVYDFITTKYPNRVLVSYIRPVQNRALPKTIKPIFTNFDIALHEYKSARLSASWLEIIGERLIKSQNMGLIVPGFAFCPKDETHFKPQFSGLYSQTAKTIAQKVVSHCKTRN